MKFTQKTKYFVYGVIATAVLVPLGTYAIKTIPLTFAEGDVMSASVLNALMSRIESATSPLTADDLVGTWTLTQIVPYEGQPNNPRCKVDLLDGNVSTCTITGMTDATDGMSRSRTDTVVISKSGSTYSFNQTNFSSFGSGGGNTTSSGNLSVLSDTVLVKTGGLNYLYDAKKINADRVVLVNKIISGYGYAGPIGSVALGIEVSTLISSFNIIQLDRKNTPPAPANAVTATVSGTSVALAWTDQSIDETGFKVQYKTSAKGSWTTSATAAANATAHTITGLTAGTYWIRVIATNTYGDAISSSEIQAVLQ